MRGEVYTIFEPGVITFAIPFHSATKYLPRALDSVRAQSDARWRCLVVDESGAAEQLVRGDPRIQYFRNPKPLGMAANWNRCIELAETDLVVLLHEDDELLPDYTATMLRAADEHPEAGIVYCNVDIIGPDSRPAFSFPDFIKLYFVNPSRNEKIILEGEAGVRALLKGDFIVCPTMCLRKSRLNVRFATDYKLVQDIELITQHLLGGGTIVGLPDVCYRYRRHNANATAEYTRSLLRFHEESAYYDRVLKIAEERGWRSCIRPAQQKNIIKLNLMFVTLRSLVQGRFGEVGRGVDLFLRQIVK